MVLRRRRQQRRGVEHPKAAPAGPGSSSSVGEALPPDLGWDFDPPGHQGPAGEAMGPWSLEYSQNTPSNGLPKGWASPTSSGEQVYWSSGGKGTLPSWGATQASSGGSANAGGVLHGGSNSHQDVESGAGRWAPWAGRC